MNDSKTHILQTAISLFLQKSYRDVTMRELVEKSGFSKGAFYHYFTSKEDLFREIVNYLFSFGKIEYSKLDQQSFRNFYKGYANKIISSFDAMMSFFSNGLKNENPVNFFLIMFEAINRFPEFLDIEQEMHIRDIEAWTKIIEKAKSTGELKLSIDNIQVAENYMCILDGLTLRMVSIRKTDYLKNEILKTFDSLYDGIKA